MPERFPGGVTGLAGSDSVPMTIRAEIGHMSLEEAIASGLFDNPDEPGMVRIPVTIHLALTPELLEAMQPAQAQDERSR